MSTPDQRLKDLGLVLPTPAPPVANYVGFVLSGNLLVISGQLCFGLDGKLAATGKLGNSVSLEAGKTAARWSGINILAQINAAAGSLDRVGRIVRLGGFIACGPEFTQHPAVMNGASDLMVEIFGDRGRHARTTIGVPALPLDSAVEVEALVELKP